MASTTATAGGTRDDRELARLALAGDGDAFAELYDRHERRVFGFCLRMLGNEDEAAEATQETFMRLLRRLPALEGRELNFVAYALTAARHACYDTIRARRRIEPVGEPLEPTGPEPGHIELDPERAAMLAATREAVRAANARLPQRQREALALRELEQLSYEQIGELVGLNANAVAQLISRARIKLRDLVCGSALESIAASSPECERALALLARVEDAQPQADRELAWVRAHLDRCHTCRLSRAAMQEAGASYRALGPIVVLAWLRHATIARAAELVGADWSHLAAHTGAGSDAHRPGPHDAGAQLTERGARGDGGGGELRLAARRLRRKVAAAAALCVLLGLVLSATLTRERQARKPSALPRVTTVQASAPRPIHPFPVLAHARRTGHSGAGYANGALQPSTPTVSTAGTPPGVQASPSLSASSPPARHRAGRHAAARPPAHNPTPASPPVAVTPPPATTPTSTQAPASPSGEAPPATTGTTTAIQTTPTAPGTPGGPPAGGEHHCALAVAC